MKVTRRSPYTGKLNTLELDVTAAQMREAEGPHPRRLIQEIFPDLPPPLREFILTGYTPEDWDDLFKEQEADNATEEDE
jgi:hypothetical protein